MEAPEVVYLPEGHTAAQGQSQVESSVLRWADVNGHVALGTSFLSQRPVLPPSVLLR